MRKIITSFILLIYLTIAFFQNSMVTFAMQENFTSHMNLIEAECCVDTDLGTEQNQSDCDHECCFESKWFIFQNVINLSNSNLKIEKTKIKNYVDIFDLSNIRIENKNLVNKTSPPIFCRELKNYSYSSLIKIIKSNI